MRARGVMPARRSELRSTVALSPVARSARAARQASAPRFVHRFIELRPVRTLGDEAARRVIRFYLITHDKAAFVEPNANSIISAARRTNLDAAASRRASHDRTRDSPRAIGDVRRGDR